MFMCNWYNKFLQRNKKYINSVIKIEYKNLDASMISILEGSYFLVTQASSSCGIVVQRNTRNYLRL